MTGLVRAPKLARLMTNVQSRRDLEANRLDSRAMKLRFVKMNGLGNDFMVVEWPEGLPKPDAELVRRWGDRRLGVGFDQLLLLGAERPKNGDASYRIFNADGGEVEQCGNGVRCLASFLAPRVGSELTLVGPAGTSLAKVASAERVSVDFGAVSMGNPHIVIPVDSVERAPVGILGPVLERHPSFPQRVNVGFMQRVDERHVKLR